MSQQQQPSKQVCMMIAGSLMMGVLIFGAVMAAQGKFRNPNPDPVLTGIGVGAAALMAVLSFVIPPIIVSNAARQMKSGGRQLTEQNYLALFQTQMIIRFAMLEGAIFMNLVLDHQFSLPVAAALLVNMILQFPTPGRIDNWVRNRMELDSFENPQD
ncbi:MAG: hypothetical protein KDA78_04705 [Planctomycetaceae bacterium]|nr:hypothetical protein [Planctomycetaceae bacterium]